MENAISQIGTTSNVAKIHRFANKETCAITKKKPKFLKSPLVMCDKCAKAYILDVLMDLYPRGLEDLPDGLWICPACIEKGVDAGGKYGDEVSKCEENLREQRALLEVKMRHLKEKQESLVEKQKEKIAAREQRVQKANKRRMEKEQAMKTKVRAHMWPMVEHL